MEDIKKETESAETALRLWQPTKIHFGEGSIQMLGNVAKRYSDRVLIITGEGSIKKSGYLDKIKGILDGAFIQHQICKGIEPNPSKETVYKIAYHLLAGNFNCLIAVGGGSVMDAAKAAGMLATIKKGELEDYFGVGMVSKKIKNIMPLIVVPSTSGSGSEVTKFSVITDTRLKVKKLMIDPAIIAAEAIVDPELTYSCARQVTLVSGLDTMTHLIEGYLNTVDENSDPSANDRALVGLKLLFEALPQAIENPNDRESRRRMSLASVLGGTVLFYKQAGGPHLNSFSWCNVMDHGEACAVMLPYYAAYYGGTVTEKLKRINEILGVKDSGNTAKDFADGLRNFYKNLDFPLTLKEFKNFSKDLIEKAVTDASQNTMKLAAMPRPVPLEKSDEILRTIINGAYNGTLEEILRL
ncbi:MAG: iron-containing alcohol dehydrogenase [Desulfobacterales bacterium]|nr:MAG: iron-containing alcohol dehydrogenase [Desulfobacterales bacterium]